MKQSSVWLEQKPIMAGILKRCQLISRDHRLCHATMLQNYDNCSTFNFIPFSQLYWLFLCFLILSFLTLSRGQYCGILILKSLTYIPRRGVQIFSSLLNLCIMFPFIFYNEWTNTQFFRLLITESVKAYWKEKAEVSISFRPLKLYLILPRVDSL